MTAFITDFNLLQIILHLLVGSSLFRLLFFATMWGKLLGAL